MFENLKFSIVFVSSFFNEMFNVLKQKPRPSGIGKAEFMEKESKKKNLKQQNSKKQLRVDLTAEGVSIWAVKEEITQKEEVDREKEEKVVYDKRDGVNQSSAHKDLTAAGNGQLENDDEEQNRQKPTNKVAEYMRQDWSHLKQSATERFLSCARNRNTNRLALEQRSKEKRYSTTSDPYSNGSVVVVDPNDEKNKVKILDNEIPSRGSPQDPSATELRNPSRGSLQGQSATIDARSPPRGSPQNPSATELGSPSRGSPQDPSATELRSSLKSQRRNNSRISSAKSVSFCEPDDKIRSRSSNSSSSTLSEDFPTESRDSSISPTDLQISPTDFGTQTEFDDSDVEKDDGNVRMRDEVEASFKYQNLPTGASLLAQASALSSSEKPSRDVKEDSGNDNGAVSAADSATPKRVERGGGGGGAEPLLTRFFRGSNFFEMTNSMLIFALVLEIPSVIFINQTILNSFSLSPISTFSIVW